MTIYRFGEAVPVLGDGVFVAPGARVIGEVTVGDQSSIWYGTVVRGDVNHVRIGRQTNLQDGCVVHVTTARHPAVIGDQVTVGHGAVVHGCTVGDRCLLGMGAIVLDGAELGEGCLVAAGALVPPGKVFPARSLVVGSPARVKGTVDDDDLAWILRSAEHYVELAQRHMTDVQPV